MTNQNAVNNREIILESLLEILEKGNYSHIILKNVQDKYGFLPKQERAFIQKVCKGTIERCIQLDYVLNQFSKTKVAKMKPVIRTILRMGVYQILFLDSVPDSAACNESVKLASRKGFGALKGFVNGVLRNISRQKESIVYPRKEDTYPYLSVMYSIPEWLVILWCEQYGNDAAESICRAFLEERPVTLRIDETLPKVEKNKLLAEWDKAGLRYEMNEKLAYAYHVKVPETVSEIPGFSDGRVMVQDIGSMLVTEMAEIKPNNKVIDVCGAPGGKALHAACKLQGTGFVDVRDISENKKSLIQENIDRSQYKNIKATVRDALILEEEDIETADIVIADLPCSGLGVIGRKSDIKYRITEKDIEEISILQKEILQVVHRYVKKDGCLVYSTCTLTQKENRENRDWILEHLPFQLEDEQELLPGVHNSDGFYMARFRFIKLTR